MDQLSAPQHNITPLISPAPREYHTLPLTITSICYLSVMYIQLYINGPQVGVKYLHVQSKKV